MHGWGCPKVGAAFSRLRWELFITQALHLPPWTAPRLGLGWGAGAHPSLSVTKTRAHPRSVALTALEVTNASGLLLKGAGRGL